MLSALGPMREAIFRAQLALDEGKEVVFVCFRRDIAEFLTPLRSEKIHIHLHEESLTFTVSKILGEIARIRAFKRKLAQLYGHLISAEVWCYGSSISLTSILALHYFSGRETVFYNGVYEGRGAADGIFLQKTKSLWRRVKAAMLSLCSGADIEFVRDWSPVPVLAEKYIQEKTRPAPLWNSANPRVAIEKPLLRPCNKQILLLFTNYSDYYRANEQDKAAFETFCETLGEMLRISAPGRGVAVKPHPTCSKLPANWNWMEQFDPQFPLEFIDMTNVRVILGDASTSMISPMNLDHKPVVSFAKL